MTGPKGCGRESGWGKEIHRPAASGSSLRVKCTGAILAGGRSRRLGWDKATLLLGGKPLAHWVAEQLAPLTSVLWLVTNTPLPHVALGLPLLTDLVPDQGPLGGLRTALFFSRTSWVLAVSVDNPFLPEELLIALTEQATKTTRPAVLYRSDQGLEPFPGLYHVRLLQRLGDYLQNRRHVRPFLETLRPREIPLPMTTPFFNINTPEDLRQAEKWLTQSRGPSAIYP
jgi:molybdopterin-guanine dinucleotide biosynthesis protein A|uniref:Probable molybdenum cofactor guanylyltransferase n=1 Tax=Desulfobacca acetoxidans TaxID=60893 RepID=A0A7C5EMY4_9BACT